MKHLHHSSHLHGYSLMELVVIIGITTSILGISISTAKNVIATRHRITSEHLEMRLYQLHATAKGHRSDQWLTETNGSITSTAPTPTLPWKSSILINGTHQLGYTGNGTTKYAGTSVIENRYKVSLGVNIGRPNLTDL